MKDLKQEIWENRIQVPRNFNSCEHLHMWFTYYVINNTNVVQTLFSFLPDHISPLSQIFKTLFQIVLIICFLMWLLIFKLWFKILWMFYIVAFTCVWVVTFLYTDVFAFSGGSESSKSEILIHLGHLFISLILFPL